MVTSERWPAKASFESPLAPSYTARKFGVSNSQQGLRASPRRISDWHTTWLRRCLKWFANPVPLTQRLYVQTAPKLCKGQTTCLCKAAAASANQLGNQSLQPRPLRWLICAAHICDRYIALAEQRRTLFYYAKRCRP